MIQLPHQVIRPTPNNTTHAAIMRSFPSASHTHPIPSHLHGKIGEAGVFFQIINEEASAPSARNGRWRDVRKINGIATGIPNEKLAKSSRFSCTSPPLRRYLHHYHRKQIIGPVRSCEKILNPHPHHPILKPHHPQHPVSSSAS